MTRIRSERLISFELLGFDDLDMDEKTVVLAALDAQSKSNHAQVRAGAAMMAHNGKMTSMPNDIPGSEGHAEMRCLSDLYNILPVGHKKLKCMAIGVALPGEKLIRREKPYTCDDPFESITWSRPCGKCLEFLCDCTDNVPDVVVLGIAISGQVMKTTLRSLMTWAYVSVAVSYDYARQTPVYRVKDRNERYPNGLSGMDAYGK